MSGHQWTDAEDARLTALYPDTPTVMVAKMLDSTYQRVYQRALKLGLKKNPITEGTTMSESTEIAVRNPLRTIVAVTPQQMTEAQATLTTWALEKLDEARQIATELGESADAAGRHGLSPTGIRRAQKRAEQSVVFYEKVNEAVKEGYVLVPNFPLEVFCVRTEHSKPRGQIDTSSSWEDLPNPQSEAPALGDGENVAGNTLMRRKVPYKRLVDGKEQQRYQLIPTGFCPVAFPATLIQPEVIEATGRAMAMKCFDEIGLVGTPRKDPIVIGTIYQGPPRNRKRQLSFFVAWWLDFRAMDARP